MFQNPYLSRFFVLLAIALPASLPGLALAEPAAPASGMSKSPTAGAVQAVEQPPVADAHLHYKWNQAEVTSPEAAVKALKDNHVRLAVVTGTPAERALELQALAPDIVVPIYGVYRRGGDWYGWQGRDEMDLSARDPWRFVSFPISGDDGRLLPAWEALVLRWPERFIIGSDAVWPVDRLDAWDRADTGWEHIGDFLAFHRRWASFLPEDVRRKVLLENAVRVFRPD